MDKAQWGSLLNKARKAAGIKTNLKTAYAFDRTIGSFDGHVSPLLVAFTFHGSLISKKQVTPSSVRNL